MKKFVSLMIVCILLCMLPISAAASNVNDAERQTPAEAKAEAKISSVNFEAPKDLKPSPIITMDVGDYSFDETEENSTPEDARVIYNDYTVSGTVGSYDMDYFYFELNSPSDVAFVLMAGRRGPVAAIFDSNAEKCLIASSDLGYDSGYYFDSISCTLDAGSYYLVITDGDSLSYTSYIFYFEAIPQETILVEWKQINGKWYCYTEDGEVLTGWWEIDGLIYYFDANGVMQTGWVQDSYGTYYYLMPSGAMATGWVQVGSNWYYLGANGAMATGWVQVGGNWYYLGANGAMTTGWVQVGNSWYYMRSNGTMATGWVQVGGNWYYLNSNGSMYTGWLQQGQKWYYLKADGIMVTGKYWINNRYYTFDSNGVWIS